MENLRHRLICDLQIVGLQILLRAEQSPQPSAVSAVFMDEIRSTYGADEAGFLIEFLLQEGTRARIVSLTGQTMERRKSAFAAVRFCVAPTRTRVPRVIAKPKARKLFAARIALVFARDVRHGKNAAMCNGASSLVIYLPWRIRVDKFVGPFFTSENEPQRRSKGASRWPPNFGPRNSKPVVIGPRSVGPIVGQKERGYITCRLRAT